MPEIKIKLLTETAKLPTKSFPTDACFDVFADRIERKDSDFYVVHLGFATEIPDGWKGVCVPRSSFTGTHWLVQNSPGQIDSSYRGEWQFRFRGLPYLVKSDVIEYQRFPFEIGDRVGQIYFEPVNPTTFTLTETLSESARSVGGFGSTGK